MKTGLKCCSHYLIVLLFVILGLFSSTSNGKRQQIEEIAKRQLDTLLQTEDYLAVFWHGKNCKTCERISSILETKTSELEDSGIKVVKLNDKKAAKQNGILSVPGLTFYKGGKGSNFEGDLTDEEAIMDFLASPEALELEDQIEEVNARHLEKLVKERPFVAVFFYNHQPESAAVLAELENIDTQADKMNIAFVKICDLELVDEYGLEQLPAIVYYRQTIPIPYEGDLKNENAVLEWLIQHRSTGEEGEVIEEATAKSLEAMVGTVDKIVVLFYDPDSRKLEQLLETMETIDDDCSKRDISFVKTAEQEAVEAYGITKLPALVFFKQDIPNLYEGNLLDETAALQWILSQSEEDSIEELTGSMLDKLITQTRHLVVLFYERHADETPSTIELLETIDDDLDKYEAHLVKTSDLAAAEDYGVKEFLPTIVYFENGIPSLFGEPVNSAPKTLEWLMEQIEGDSIEDVTDEMLDKLVSGHLAGNGYSNHQDVGVLFYSKDDPESQRVIEALENIDDDCDRNGIILVKIDNAEEAEAYGIETIPALIYFENTIPNFFEGNLRNDNEVLGWLIHQMKNDEIEEVTDEMLEMLVKNHQHVAALIYDKDDRMSSKVLSHLESIDDDAEKNLIFVVKLSPEDIDEANKELEFAGVNLDELPALILFTEPDDRVVVYEGDLTDETNVLAWLIKETEPEALSLTIPQEDDKTVKKAKKEAKAEAKADVKAETKPAKKETKKAAVVDEGEKPAKKEAKKAAEDKPAKKETKKVVEEKPAKKEAKPAAEEKKKAKADPEEKPAKKVQKKDLPDEDDSEPAEEPKPVKKEKKPIALSLKVPAKDEDEATEEEKPVAKKEKKPIALSLKVPAEDEKPAKKEPKKEKKTEKADKKADKPAKADKKADKPAKTDKKAEKPAKSEKKSDKADKAEKKSDKAAKSEKAEKADKPAKAEKVAKGEKPAGVKEVKKPKSPPKKLEEVVEEEQEGDEEEEEEKLSVNDEVVNAVTNNRNVVGFFYDKIDKVVTKIISGLSKIEDTYYLGRGLIFMNIEAEEVTDITVTNVPSIVYFKNGHPTVYEDNMMNDEAIYAWIDGHFQSNQDIIEDFSAAQIKSFLQNQTYLMVFVYAPNCDACEEALKHLEDIDDDADAVGVRMVKTEDKEFVKTYGIEEFPTVVYFEKDNPHIYNGDAREESELLTWLLYQMKEDTIENINRDLLVKMIGQHEFLGVFFYTDNEDSSKMLRHLELIDDEALEYGVKMVKLNDPLMAKKYGHRDPPGLGYFRKGNYVKYDGDEFDDEEMLDWLTDPNVMEVNDQIEQVNRKMFDKLTSLNENVAVLFVTEHDCKTCDPVLEELETIDDEAEAAGIPIVKLEDKELAKSIGVFAHPSLVIFRQYGKEPIIYAGDLKNEDSILEWLLVQKDPTNEAIEEQDGEGVRNVVENSEAVAVFIYTHDECETCLDILQGLENIDDDADRQNIALVKTTDADFAAEMGVQDFPSLVFFKEGIPNLFDGDMNAEEEVLDWLIEMKVENHIEHITRPMLEVMVVEVQYLAVFFYKQNCRTCDQILVELENIDDECDGFGIQMVKLQDPVLAKRYGIKTFPSLVYFRNGNPLTFDGDLKDEVSVLAWLLDDNNRELDDAIESVNFKMLDKLLDKSPFMAVFFYDEDCAECDVILESLENIDEEADIYGIDFVKNDEPHAARHYHIYNTPALVYFRQRFPVVFEGDLTDEEGILSWLTSQEVFEIPDEIEEVNRKMLEKILEENEFVAVYFYSDDCKDCEKVLKGLEKIDQEADALDITFVKVNDHRYAKKYGVNKLPSLVYFRRKFPSIYRDNLLDEVEILDWLKRNRYKPVELHWIMYSVLSVALAFLLYSLFILYGLKEKEVEVKKED